MSPKAYFGVLFILKWFDLFTPLNMRPTTLRGTEFPTKINQTWL